MKPKFKNTLAWEQAQILMQPTFIRVLDNLRKQVEKTSWQADYQEASNPFPGYKLVLSRQERKVEIDIWDLCFQICFSNYDPEHIHVVTDLVNFSYEVDIDTTLLSQTGEVNWEVLEEKAKHLVEKVFANL